MLVEISAASREALDTFSKIEHHWTLPCPTPECCPHAVPPVMRKRAALVEILYLTFANARRQRKRAQATICQLPESGGMPPPPSSSHSTV